MNNPFRMNDTDPMVALSKQIVAIPDLFGYSEEEGDLMWPEYIYPKCNDTWS